jgi:hypothetical protein
MFGDTPSKPRLSSSAWPYSREPVDKRCRHYGLQELINELAELSRAKTRQTGSLRIFLSGTLLRQSVLQDSASFRC